MRGQNIENTHSVSPHGSSVVSPVGVIIIFRLQMVGLFLSNELFNLYTPGKDKNEQMRCQQLQGKDPSRQLTINMQKDL